MDRREFLFLVGAGLLSLSGATPAMASSRRRYGTYSVILLGDTHYDGASPDVYHSHYIAPSEKTNASRQAEFARNGDMWRERCPRLVSRAARLAGPRTKMVIQMGDLIQGDCDDFATHTQMLDDAFCLFKNAFPGLPFVTVTGNHDIRGRDAEKAYRAYMPARMSAELGIDIRKTTFSFRIGPDVFIAIDFNHPDDEEILRLLAESTDARYTFVVSHSGLFPLDSGSPRWFFHGGKSDEETARRRQFRALFAQRNVICLCGHTHTTDFHDWQGDGGRITQSTINSVWRNDATGQYNVDTQHPNHYGTIAAESRKEKALFDEYRSGLLEWTHSRAAGSYRLNVSDRAVTLDFYAADSESRTQRFYLRH